MKLELRLEYPHWASLDELAEELAPLSVLLGGIFPDLACTLRVFLRCLPEPPSSRLSPVPVGDDMLIVDVTVPEQELLPLRHDLDAQRSLFARFLFPALADAVDLRRGTMPCLNAVADELLWTIKDWCADNAWLDLVEVQEKIRRMVDCLAREDARGFTELNRLGRASYEGVTAVLAEHKQPPLAPLPAEAFLHSRVYVVRGIRDTLDMVVPAWVREQGQSGYSFIFSCRREGKDWLLSLDDFLLL